MKPGNSTHRRGDAETQPPVKKTAHDWRKRQAEIKAELDQIDREIELHSAANPKPPEHLRD